jgi:hypothetical protein
MFPPKARRTKMMIKGAEYTLGLNRDTGADKRNVAHLYRGTFGDPGWPMCRRGWNRDDGTAYAIWRNNGGLGICRICLRRAEQGLPPVPPKGHQKSNDVFTDSIGDQPGYTRAEVDAIIARDMCRHKEEQK